MGTFTSWWTRLLYRFAVDPDGRPPDLKRSGGFWPLGGVEDQVAAWKGTLGLVSQVGDPLGPQYHPEGAKQA
jgi:hypothetical protein